MKDNDNTRMSVSLCKDCKFRFRRILIPENPEEFVDENGESLLETESENILIVIICLISGMEINNDVTLECNKFSKKDSAETVPFFKHLN